ncbi:MAG: hypothetical protein QM831_05795 [Kofleriaceae bacterium]
MNKVDVPTNNQQSTEYGLDLDGKAPVDNQLGMVLSQLASPSLGGFDIQGTINKAVLDGSIILLADVQTSDATFASDSATGLSVYLGQNPMPAACNTGEMADCTGDTCTGCGHQLSPSGGSFDVMAGNSDLALAGKIVGGTFNGGPGNLTIQIALSGAPIELDLIGARVKASQMSAATIGSMILGGALSQDDINNKVIPAVVTQLQPTIARDCTMLNNPPDCGCAASSTGKTILGIFDKNPVDCMITQDEVVNNAVVSSLLAPDVTINGVKALSLGIKVTAEMATFPQQ